MADLDHDYQIKILQAQVKALLVALNEVRAKCDLAKIQIPQAASHHG